MAPFGEGMFKGSMMRRALLLGLLLLPGILGWHGAVYAAAPPTWLPGRYAGFDPWSNRNVRLTVRRDGRATLDITDRLGRYLGQKTGGYRGNARILLSHEWYSVHRIGNNVRLTYLNGNHDDWLFYRQ
jgi:hypothetical protein